MCFLIAAACVVCFIAAAAPEKHIGALRPGQFFWEPEVSPSGPLVIIVSLPDQTLSVAAVVGDGEAETGPLAGAWKSVKYSNCRARRRGAADPAFERI